MFKKLLRFSTKPLWDLILKTLLCAALLSLAGPFSIPMDDGLSVTLQTLFVLLPAVLFGWEVGLLSVGLYIGLGAIGLPVLPASKLSFGERMNVYGGFYFGFLFAAGVVGYAAERLRLQFLVSQAILWIGGHVLILVFGFYWLWSVVWEPQGSSATEMLSFEMKNLTPGLVIKCALGILIAQIIKRILDRGQKSGLA